MWKNLEEILESNWFEKILEDFLYFQTFKKNIGYYLILRFNNLKKIILIRFWCNED